VFLSPGFFIAPVSISVNFGESGLFKNILVIDPGGVRVKGAGVPASNYDHQQRKEKKKYYSKIQSQIWNQYLCINVP
jgi:hypothetical protein